MTFKTRATFVARGGSGRHGAVAHAQPPRDLYTRALARDRAVRDARQAPTLRQIRAAVAAYERVVQPLPGERLRRQRPVAGRRALAPGLGAFRQRGRQANRRAAPQAAAVRLSVELARCPASTRPWRVSRRSRPLPTRDSRAAARTAAAGSRRGRSSTTADAVEPATRPAGVVTVRGITRTALPDGVRVSIEMDRELLFRQERLENPRRVFFDLRGAHLSPGLARQDAQLLRRHRS